MRIRILLSLVEKLIYFGKNIDSVLVALEQMALAFMMPRNSAPQNRQV